MEKQEVLLSKIVSLVQVLSSFVSTRMEQLEKKLAASQSQKAPGTSYALPKTQAEGEEHAEDDEEDEEEPAVDADDEAKHEEEEEDENDDEE